MSDHEDVDPVRDFFERERAAVTPMPTSEEHWDSIVAAHRRSRRSRTWTVLLGAAAAILMIGGVVWATSRPAPDQIASPGPTTSRTLSTTGATSLGPTTSTPPPSTGPTTVPTTSASTSPTTVRPPARGRIPGFTVRSVSTAADGVLFALGEGSCGGTPCPTVARSSDDGATWTMVKQFAGTRLAAHESGASSGLGRKGTLRDIRFATKDIGYVFGGDAWRTTDGGRTWTRFGTSGEVALALESDGKTVDVVTAASCDGTGCAGPLHLQSGSVGATSTQDGPISIPATDALTISDVTLTLRRYPGGDGIPAGSSAVVSYAAASGESGLVQTVEGDAPQPVDVAGCTGKAAQSFQAADNTTTFGWCVAGAAAGTMGVDLSVETPGGWSALGTLTMPTGAVTVTAADRTHLVAASAADPSTGGALKFTVDGGRTWTAARFDGAAPSRAGFSWVGAAGGGQVLAVEAGDSSGYWKSADSGATWVKVPIGD